MEITAKREAEKTFPIMEARNRAIARSPRRHVLTTAATSAATGAGALEINFGLMSHPPTPRILRRDDKFPMPSRRDIPNLDRGIHLKQAIRASLVKRAVATAGVLYFSHY